MKSLSKKELKMFEKKIHPFWQFMGALVGLLLIALVLFLFVKFIKYTWYF